MIDFKDVQYVYTNKCNLSNKTNYCNVPKNIIQKANIENIKRACDIFKKYNLQVKVLGGNPSDEDDFCEFIEYMNKINLEYIITDNAFNIDKLLSIPIKGVMFSLDTLGKNNIGGCSYDKSIKAKDAIEKYADRFDYVGANVVINSLNIDEIPKIIKFLTEYNVIANICPIMTGYNKDFIFRVEDSPYQLSKLKNRYEKLNSLSKELISMKKSGYKIGVPELYLEHLPDVILKSYYGWNCYHINSIPILRVNVDLSLMICSDIKGNSICKYNVFDLENKCDDINKQWITDTQRIHCCEHNGCYWSNIVIADYYRKEGYGTIEATRRNL